MAAFLWFDGQAEQAATFYASTFPDSRITSPQRSGDGPATSVSLVICGREFVAFNGGPHFKFTEAISFQIVTDDQDETDRLWSAITSDGGTESRCGWCKDRWGLSWQIVPRALMKALSSDDRAAAGRTTNAMMTMKKIDVAAIETAFAG